MSHCTASQLSMYVDAELRSSELQRVELHLVDCESCRDRLEGLGKLVGELRRLERATPPSELGHRVERAVHFPSSASRWWENGETWASSWLRPPTVAPLFGVVLALAVLVYLASVYGARQNARGTRLVIPPSVEGSAAAEPPTGSGELQPGVVYWADRVFLRRGNGWRESGLPEIEPVTVLDLAVVSGIELDPLVTGPLAGPVRMRLGGEVVEVVFPRSSR